MKQNHDLRPGATRSYTSVPLAHGTDVRVSEMTLVGEQCVPWHLHTETADIFVCIEGALRIRVKDRERDVILPVGDRYELAAGLEHQVESADRSRARFVLIQGVGKVDFIATGQTRSPEKGQAGGAS